MFGDKSDFDCWKRLMPIDHKGMVEPNEYLSMGVFDNVCFHSIASPFPKGERKKSCFMQETSPSKGEGNHPLPLFPTQKKLF
jgi:hypothetical protein